jgi:hypothetical protein
MAPRTRSQSPPARNEAVVAPLWPWFAPEEPAATVEDRKASPQPPPGAVVESPASSQWTGLEELRGAGDAAVDMMGRRDRYGMRMVWVEVWVREVVVWDSSGLSAGVFVFL